MKATTDVVGQYFDPATDKVRAQLEIDEKARRKLDNDRMNEQHEAKARAREAMAGAGLKSSLFGERADPKADVPEANALRERVVQEEVDQELAPNRRAKQKKKRSRRKKRELKGRVESRTPPTKTGASMPLGPTSPTR